MISHMIQMEGIFTCNAVHKNTEMYRDRLNMETVM